VRPDKPTSPPIAPEALRQDAQPKQTREGWPMLDGRLAIPGSADTFIAYARGWANVSNTPCRFFGLDGRRQQERREEEMHDPVLHESGALAEELLGFLGCWWARRLL